MLMCEPEQRVVRAPVQVKSALMKPDTPVTNCIGSYWLQLAAHGYTTRTLAFALALRFLKRDLLSLMCHIRCSTFTWVALQVWKRSENLISNFFPSAKIGGIEPVSWGAGLMTNMTSSMLTSVTESGWQEIGLSQPGAAFYSSLFRR